MSELPTPIMQQAGETPERQAGAFERIDCAHDIELSLKLARGGVAGFDLSVDLTLPSSGTTVIFGPSGGP